MNTPHTKIPNDVMTILTSEALNDIERRILLFIARKTYGFHKTSDKISYSQFEKELNLSRPTIVKTLARLTLVGITKLVKKGNTKREPNEWMIDDNDYTNKLVGITKLVKYDKEKLVGITYPQKKYTKENIYISEQNLTSVANNCKIPPEIVKKKYAEMQDYCRRTGKYYDDPKKQLQQWIEKDIQNRKITFFLTWEKRAYKEALKGVFIKK